MEIILINCKFNLILTWSEIVLYVKRTEQQLAITDTQFYFPLVTLSTNYNTKLLHQLKLDFKRTISWNKYQLKVTIQQQNPYLDYLTDPSFHGVNRLFVLSFENNA